MSSELTTAHLCACALCQNRRLFQAGDTGKVSEPSDGDGDGFVEWLEVGKGVRAPVDLRQRVVKIWVKRNT